jgi:Holliday junction resolvasome RuvABC ATP-dependent DNA helicase subunit
MNMVKRLSLTFLLATGGCNMLCAIDPVGEDKKQVENTQTDSAQSAKGSDSNGANDQADQSVATDDQARQDESNQINDYKAAMDRLSAQIATQYEAAKSRRQNEYSEVKNNELAAAGKEAAYTAGGYVWKHAKEVAEGAFFGFVAQELQAKIREYWNEYNTEKTVPLTKKDVAYIPKNVANAIENVKKAELFNKGNKSKELKASFFMQGRPGTGKSFQSQVMASELDMEFISLVVTDLQSKYMGESARKLRNVFAKARKSKKGTVIFIDEIHACGSSGAGADDDHKHIGDIHTALLAELEGAKGVDNSNIVFIGATNHDETIEKALRERMPDTIALEMPTKEERVSLLKFHFNKYAHVLTDKDFEYFAGHWTTGGWNARAFKSLPKQSRGVAIEQGKVAIDRVCVLKALPKVHKSFKEDLLSKKSIKVIKKASGSIEAVAKGVETGGWWGIIKGTLGLAAVLGHN